MKRSCGDRNNDRKKAPEDSGKKPYQAPAWEEEEVLEKTALACGKIRHICVPGPVIS